MVAGVSVTVEMEVGNRLAGTMRNELAFIVSSLLFRGSNAGCGGEKGWWSCAVVRMYSTG